MRIEEYGLIGDLHTAALVGSNGSIDWLCVPRFDSAACFASLLGTEENGFWKLAPSDGDAAGRQTYRGETLILQTSFATAAGEAVVTDCMSLIGPHRTVVRMVEGIAGEVQMRFQLSVRFDYGQTVPWVQSRDGGVIAIAGPNALLLKSEVPTRGEGFTTVAEFTVKKGERKSFSLTWYPSHQAEPAAPDPFRVIEHAEAFWKEWSSRCVYQGEYREALVRSLLTLKALTYAPTGGIVAAPTTSLPEFVGGVRNWDYRFCWLRDTTFTLYAMMGAGYTGEAQAWIEWLLRAAAGEASQLQIMYGVSGERNLTELELSHLSGYENSRPVRTGNAASEQFQLDIYGEVLNAFHLAREMKIPAPDAAWPLQKHLVSFVEKHWSSPDEGIWEIRGPRRHFTHSKVMAWLAIDRAVKAVENFKLEGDLDRWRSLRNEMHATICREGFNAKRGAFTQFFGSDRLDASLLLIPLVGFLPIDDPRVVGTIELIKKELTLDGLVLRYAPDDSAAVDGLPPGEGVFLPCSFWMVSCLAEMDRMVEAKELLEHLLSLRNRLGLISEEYDPVAGRLLGNFPQAFTHVGLIRAIQRLSPDCHYAGPTDAAS